MAIHPSLKLSEKDKKTRSVLKRTERLRLMMSKDKWKAGDNVYGLPKIKALRIKIKKEKAAEKTETPAAAGATPAAAETKEQTDAKTTAKGQEKK